MSISTKSFVLKSLLNGASGAALLVGLLGANQPAMAQTAGQRSHANNGPIETIEQVVVTGSLIRGSQNDAALPVQAISQATLELKGSPSPIEMAKDLTMSGPTTGESYYFGGPALTGVTSLNLRNLGAGETLTLFNGRRSNNNLTIVPQIALARTEILEDGAATTYGADATGGVVNLITRPNFVGLEARGQYRYIKDTVGEWSMGLLAGIGEDGVNLMVSGEWAHRSRLHAIDRGFARSSLLPMTDPDYNPSPWSSFTNLVLWATRGALPAVPSSANDTAEWGPVLGYATDFTASSCAAVGGHTLSYSCAYNYVNYYNLVEDQDTYRAFAQLNAKINNKMAFHMDAFYGMTWVPEVMASPSQPIVQGPALTSGYLYQYYVPITNPYAAQFAAANGITGASGFTPYMYRVMAHGGNNAMSNDGFGVPDKVKNSTWHVSADVTGDLGSYENIVKDVNYDLAVTYNQANSFNTHPDIIGYRFQEALDGFGGPDCHATDLDPTRFGTQNPMAAGKNGCMYWNPFSTSFAGQPVLHLANPNYVSGRENSKELTRWLFDPRATDTIASDITLDLVISGSSGLELPGGAVSWALGGQYRHLESHQDIPDPIYNGTQTCPWPSNFTGVNGAGSAALPQIPASNTDSTYRGCGLSDSPFILFATQIPVAASRAQDSVFGELQIPVFDTLNFQLGGRREEFGGGLKTTVWKVAGKWDVWGPFSLRGSYGTNYLAPPLGTIPGNTVVAGRTFDAAGGNWLAGKFVVAPDLQPETAKSWNVGVITKGTGFGEDHNFQVIVDYFDIRTKGQIGTIADPNAIANLVFNGAGYKTTTCDPHVQPLLNRITFNSGCTVGMSGNGSFSMVTTLTGNGPGQVTTGFDLQSIYEFPVSTGDLTLEFNGTWVTQLKTGATFLDGVQVTAAKDRLGNLNFQTFATAAPRVRANFSANYAIERHNFRIGTNFVSAVTDERAGTQLDEHGQNYISVDFTYRFQYTEDASFTLAIKNLLDAQPPLVQEEFGYDPFIADPLGRTIELSIKYDL
jgi:outer membrane receptor protein involved in Fe transport